MGRAMLIICAAALVGLGIVGIGTANQGNLLTEKSAEYANEMTAKNAAHTAIQMAMQNINKDDNYPEWIEKYDSPDSPWVQNIGGATTELYLETLNDIDGNGFWQVDSLRMISKAVVNPDGNGKQFEATVTSVYLLEPFSTLVPEFTGALQFPNGYGNLTVDGNAHSIKGTDGACGVSKPPITVASQEIKDDIDSKDMNMDGEVEVDTTLNYEPTDELIDRLENSGNAVIVNSDYSESLGTPDNPGVFFIDGNVRLTGQQSEGYGIMVIKNSANMEYEDEDGNTLDIRGNFEFNGLVIFENAELFDGRGTPTINGSVLVGDTEGETDIELDLGGNIGINYTCAGENYARMSAASAVDQNKYTRVVTFEETGFNTE